MMIFILSGHPDALRNPSLRQGLHPFRQENVEEFWKNLVIFNLQC
jgi:hypothetical protein